MDNIYITIFQRGVGNVFKGLYKYINIKDFENDTIIINNNDIVNTEINEEYKTFNKNDLIKKVIQNLMNNRIKKFGKVIDIEYYLTAQIID